MIQKEFQELFQKVFQKVRWQKQMQKWSISNFWEHFLALKHRIPILLIFKLRLSVKDLDPTLHNDWNSFGSIDILKYRMNHEFTEPLFL